MTKGRSLELFFIDGNPDGMLTAEVFNWTGHILVAPRVKIKDALARKEAKHTGVYVLLGDQGGDSLAYIGEGEDVSNRIRNHDSAKDWWGKAIIITSAADNLHKAHVKYLESRLIEMASAVSAIKLENGTVPARSSLSEAARANMEEFLGTLHIVLPALGITIFQNKTRPSHDLAQSSDRISPRFVLETPKHSVNAIAELRGAEFVVLKGSTARQEWASKAHTQHGYKQLHDELVANGVLDCSTMPARFSENYAFNSPSAAAAIINGRSANGRLEWRLESDGRTFKEWEMAQLSLLDGEAAQ